MKPFNYILFFFLFMMAFPLIAQQQAVEDTTEILLLENEDVQIASAQAINDMYNFKFDKAESQFNHLKQLYPNHPIAYLLLGLSEWWKININIDNTQYDEMFLAYLDSAINFARILNENPRCHTEASFFLSASYGFEGRLYGERGSWTKAAFASKNSLKYFEDCKNKPYLSPELMFGDALFNYFSVWIPENYPLLKPVMAFFPKGDKQLGLQQLRTVARNAFYTRTEAQCYLMQILGSYENDYSGALLISEYLHKTFPDNSFFQRSYARMLYSAGYTGDAEKQSLQILNKIDSGVFGYELIEGRYASFFLAQINEQRRNLEGAKKYYQLCIQYAERADATDSGYYLYSNLFLGQIAIKQGDKETARQYLKKVKKESKRKDSVNKRARELLKGL
jgi:hypothetical protein